MLTVAVSYEIELQKIIVLNPKDGNTVFYSDYAGMEKKIRKIMEII